MWYGGLAKPPLQILALVVVLGCGLEQYGAYLKRLLAPSTVILRLPLSQHLDSEYDINNSAMHSTRVDIEISSILGVYFMLIPNMYHGAMNSLIYYIHT